MNISSTSVNTIQVIENMETYKIRRVPYCQELKKIDASQLEKVKKVQESIPVKLGEIAELLGVKVLKSSLPRGISGSIGIEHNQVTIRVNRFESTHRQRFTLAHELAHYLLHSERIETDGEWSENVLLRSGQPERIEYEANRLAAELIMPRDTIEADLQNYQRLTNDQIHQLAQKFRVSVHAMRVRITELPQ